MLPKCCKCGSKLTLSWFCCSSIWTKHRCVECSTLHEFTNLRDVLIAVIAITLILSSEIWAPILDSVLLSFVFISFILFLTSLIPGQHKSIEENHLD